MKDARELIRKAKRIEITSRKIVNTLFRGEYSSAFKGRGIEFSEVREYQVGDDIRDIDWNVTSRMDRPYVKVNHEERELCVILVMDVSASMNWGSQGVSKLERMIELAAVFVISAVQNGDKVGAILVGDQIQAIIEPKKGKQQVMRILRAALSANLSGTSTQLEAALVWVMKTQKRKSFVVVMSDFYANAIESPLKVLSNRHQVVPIWIEDPLEAHWPWLHSRPTLSGLEDHQIGVVAHDYQSSREISQLKRQTNLTDLFRTLKLRPLHLRMDQPYLSKLLQYFGRGKL